VLLLKIAYIFTSSLERRKEVVADLPFGPEPKLCRRGKRKSLAGKNHPY